MNQFIKCTEWSIKPLAILTHWYSLTFEELFLESTILMLVCSSIEINVILIEIYKNWPSFKFPHKKVAIPRFQRSHSEVFDFSSRFKSQLGIVIAQQ